MGFLYAAMSPRVFVCVFLLNILPSTARCRARNPGSGSAPLLVCYDFALLCRAHGEKRWVVGAALAQGPGSGWQFFSAERTKVPAFLSLPFWGLGGSACERTAAISGPWLLYVKPQALPRGKSGGRREVPGDLALGLRYNGPRCGG